MKSLIESNGATENSFHIEFDYIFRNLMEQW